MAKKRKRYTNEQKLEIARRAQLSDNVSSVARAEGLDVSIVSRWKKNIKSIEESVVGVNGADLKTVHNDKTPTLTKALQTFCETARRLKPPLPIAVESITVKAKELSARLLREHEQNESVFTDAKEAESLKDVEFSTHWSHRWLQRKNYISKRLHGEAADVDKVAVADGIACLQNTIAEYSPENVYNMDETGLNFRLLPRQTYVQKSVFFLRGTKSMKAKDRLTLYICTNATGSQSTSCNDWDIKKSPLLWKASRETKVCLL